MDTITDNGKDKLLTLVTAFVAENGGPTKAAPLLDMSTALLYSITHGLREISADTAAKFGWERVVIYRPVPAPAAEKETGAA